MAAQSGISTKLFVGTQIRPDIRLQLDQSVLWKRLQAVRETGELEELSWRGKSYIGLFVHSPAITLDDLIAAENTVRERLLAYLDDFDVSKLPVLVFPQTFIA